MENTIFDTFDKHVINPIKLVPVDFDPFSSGEVERILIPTAPQQEVWLACMLGGDDANCSYNESISLRLTGKLDQEALDAAFRSVIQRHEALRSTFTADGKQVLVSQHPNTTIAYIDIMGEDAETYLSAFNDRDGRQPFNLQEGPLFRASLFKLADQVHEFRLTVHHIICDGWSFGIILEDLSTYYSANVLGTEPAVPVKATSIGQYSREMERRKAGEAYASAAKYWRDQFKTIPTPLRLPADNPTSPKRSYASRRIDFPLAADLIKKVKQTGAAHGISLVNTLLVSFEVFLSRITGQTDIVVGLPTAGQAATGYFDVVGHCVNFLAIRSEVTEQSTLVEHLKTRKAQLLEDYEHQLFTYGELLQMLKIKRDVSRVSLVPAVFNIDMGMDTNVSFSGLQHQLISNPRVFENFELFLNATGKGETLVLEWSYNTQLFEESTIRKMMDTFENVLHVLVEAPDTPIAELITPWSTSGIARQTSAAGADPVNYPKDMPFFEFIRQHANIHPDNIAVVFEDDVLTYWKLERRSNQLANYLRQQGVKKGDVVGVAVERSAWLPVVLLAIAKSGAVYLPIDPSYPTERTSFMLSDSKARFLVTQEKFGRISGQDIYEVDIDIQYREIVNSSTQPPNPEIKGDDMVYMLYTSGSTGQPKGVLVKHHNLTNFLLSMQKTPGFIAEDTLLAVTTVSFDIAGLELYLPLIAGGKLVITDMATARDGKKLLTLIDEHQVSVMQATPTTWRMLINSGWHELKKMKALCGGEAFPRDLAEKLLDRCQSVWNMYGPTETTIWSTIKELKKGNTGEITIGKPINNTFVYILDEDLRELPQNEIGQIFISGEGVSHGYHNRPELTKQRFVSDPYVPSRTMYATGDLGKKLENGDFLCLGRMDDQVKLRGYRIELGEIEYQLAQHPGIKDAVAMVREYTLDDQRLVAYVIPADNAEGDNNTVSWKEKWDNIYNQGVDTEKGLDIDQQNLDVAILTQLGTNTEDLKAQTADWLNSSLTRIHRLAPKRVFEIGSGAGQVLFELAPQTNAYLATDYAAPAIDKLNEKLAASHHEWQHVRASVAPAADFSVLGDMIPDLVLIHSVAQYFPNMDYLVNVVRKATMHMRNGCIFLGDIQGKNTLPIHHAADQAHRTGKAVQLGSLKKTIENRLRLEDELTIDPAFFYLLPQLIPQITAVDVQLRSGQFINEITKYHYDVWLYVNEDWSIRKSSLTKNWESLEATGQLLSSHPNEIITIKGIPNRRTAGDIAITKWLNELPDVATVATLLNQAETTVTTGYSDPNDFWELGERYGFQSHVRWTSDGTDGTFEAVFVPARFNRTLPPPPVELNAGAQIEQFIRNPKEGNVELSREQIAQWKEHLKKALPAYMIPNEWVALSKFPLTANNKVDRRTLSAQQGKHEVDVTEVLPQSEQEKTITRIWSEVLHIDNIQPGDDFFELGGHSLLAVELMTKIEKVLGIRLPLATLFNHSRFMDFAKLLSPDKPETTISWKALVPIRAKGSKIPLYIVHGWGMNVLSFYSLANNLDPAQPVFGLQAVGLDGVTPPHDRLEAMASAYLDEILAHNPTGPYALAGYSAGGLIAVEMANQLKKMGKEVAFIGLLDAFSHVNDYKQLWQKGAYGTLIRYTLQQVNYSIGYLFRYPKKYIRHNFNHLMGAIYDRYAQMNPKNTNKKANALERIIYQIKLAHIRAFRKYQLEKIGGKAYLFKGENFTMDYFLHKESNGWAPYFDELTVVELPLNHLAFFSNEGVALVAKELQKQLDAETEGTRI